MAAWPAGCQEGLFYPLLGPPETRRGQPTTSARSEAKCSRDVFTNPLENLGTGGAIHKAAWGCFRAFKKEVFFGQGGADAMVETGQDTGPPCPPGGFFDPSDRRHQYPVLPLLIFPLAS